MHDYSKLGAESAQYKREWDTLVAEIMLAGDEAAKLSKEAEAESKSAIRLGVVAVIGSTMALLVQIADKLGYIN